MNSDSIHRIVAEVEYRLARRERSAQERPRLFVVHGHHRAGTICAPGESIESAYLSFPGRNIPIFLAQSGLILCDCLVRYHHSPLSIARIERILTKDPFYRRLGANSFGRIEKMPQFTRVALRVYITRLREQIAKALKKGGSMLRPEDALISATTDTNVAVHRITLPAEIVHATMKLM